MATTQITSTLSGLDLMAIIIAQVPEMLIPVTDPDTREESYVLGFSLVSSYDDPQNFDLLASPQLADDSGDPPILSAEIIKEIKKLARKGDDDDSDRDDDGRGRKRKR